MSVSKYYIFHLKYFHFGFPYNSLFICRYRQVGNAVAVPVGRALGYTLGMAVQKLTGDKPLMTLPPKFSHSTTVDLLQPSLENESKVP